VKTHELLGLVASYHNASSRRIHLIPSENPMSLAARLPLVSDVVHRYCFGPDATNPAWPGNEALTAIEHAAADGLRDLFRARHVNLKPISGVNCMAVVLSALAEPGATVLNIGEADGGHGSTRFIARRLGHTAHDIPYDPRRFAIDPERLAALAAQISGPKLVYLDQFMCLFPHDLPAIREAVGNDTLIHYDGSHALGLIAGGEFQDPLAEGADTLGGSTHKSFPGPHKGIVLTNADHLAARIDEHASHWVSHHHPGDVAALAMTVADLQGTARDYATRTVANAQHLGRALSDRGFTICGADQGFTRSHQLWIDIAPVAEPTAASQALLAAGVVVNAIDVPYLVGGVGLRLGTQEVTRLGFDTAAMDELATIFERTLIRSEPPSDLTGDVVRLRARYAGPDYSDLPTVLRVLAELVPSLEAVR
jgi:glycine/serine hydroxymethyltransferase